MNAKMKSIYQNSSSESHIYASIFFFREKSVDHELYDRKTMDSLGIQVPLISGARQANRDSHAVDVCFHGV